MKATINNTLVEGTPQEIHELIVLSSFGRTTSTEDKRKGQETTDLKRNKPPFSLVNSPAPSARKIGRPKGCLDKVKRKPKILHTEPTNFDLGNATIKYEVRK